MRRKIKRYALNRGYAEHVGGSRVRFKWACGCTKIETIKSPLGPIGETGTKLLVKTWQANGVTLEACKNHPDFYSPTKMKELIR